jgi:hypothetical protein
MARQLFEGTARLPVKALGAGETLSASTFRERSSEPHDARGLK